MRRFVRAAVCALMALFLPALPALAKAPPFLHENGLKGWEAYLDRMKNDSGRDYAFALSPDGSWGWGRGGSAYEAEQFALSYCNRQARTPCRIYARDRRVVFQPQPDAAALAAKYAAAGSTALALRTSRPPSDGVKRGTAVGEPIPDLDLTDAAGNKLTLEGMRGKAVLFQQFGTWCPYCQGEISRVNAAYRQVKDDPAIAFFLIPIREDASVTRDWLKSRKIDIPVYDANAYHGITFADGQKLRARTPTTFIIDRNGVIAFFKDGTYDGWDDIPEALKQLARGE